MSMTPEFRTSLAEVLFELPGGPSTLAEADQIVEQAQARLRARQECTLHVFSGNFNRCEHCGWKPLHIEVTAYEQGLAHGRKNPTGGGRT